ncbi:hypothetical protein [Paraburkholderia phenoliruptrix]|uniref:hypothetical protein n=1 Tax=Paraburkholderia phenoliruptrix TaxID=252970 RepID=UPI001C6E2C91|nr:hypothetical protein [Paraburkholderia phenoliruptrix]MBW9104724.1 hypothetical protein [Paraburkholderia phenoliruptrix]MBW9130508.1 hypothetical protein [Paraburkholderia ginsengiterrae]
MSAPENSNSKVPPSLLSDKAKGADGNGSRILANLEGRVAPPVEKSRRSRTPLALVALLVIAAGGWAAWHMQQRGQSEPLVAAAPASAVNVANAAVPVSAASAAAPTGANAQAAAPAPASSQAATIIADESNTDSNSKPAVASPASAEAAESRLSRALADGAEPSNGSAPVAALASAGASGASAGSGRAAAVAGSATAATAAAKHDKSSTVASRSKHEAAARSKKENTTASASHHRAGTTTASTQAKKAKPDAASKDDSDADLLAALVARTKPADAKAGGTSAATKVATSAVPGNAKLAERVKECAQRGFFEDQLCRWRVCDGHWGKDPACPGSTPQVRQP